MRKETALLVMKARMEVEDLINSKIPDSFAQDVLDHCKRKVECSGKGEEYLPVLYRDELPLRVFMSSINALNCVKEVSRNVRYLQANTV